eukprot:CAMPEP_0119515320 /NCGR_PEP_ID=MMETSP1344-20130328/32854_1 /TAXON_ID=236787 /ORGANISM="Florenciella parvula, Strain CCMP2471" /LENGTH=249 /DNA_ID=CAMNT_0007552723 /DNA_START=53 /DNA_END=799 /DNA_ORIENTATION=+
MTTLGFGDFVPRSTGGKIMTTFTTFTGILLDTLFVVSILQQISLSHYQVAEANFVARRVAIDKERMAAASFINEFCRWCMYEKKQEKLRKTLKGADFIDDPRLFQAKKKKHTLRLIRMTQGLSSARRGRELVMNTVGDPQLDQLNKIWKNMFRSEVSTQKMMSEMKSEKRSSNGDLGQELKEFMRRQSSMIQEHQLSQLGMGVPEVRLVGEGERQFANTVMESMVENGEEHDGSDAESESEEEKEVQLK